MTFIKASKITGDTYVVDLCSRKFLSIAFPAQHKKVIFKQATQQVIDLSTTDYPIQKLSEKELEDFSNWKAELDAPIPANSYTIPQLLLEREHRNDALVERMKATEEMREGAEEALKTASADLARLVIKYSQSHKVVKKLDNEIVTLKRTYKRLQDKYRKLNGQETKTMTSKHCTKQTYCPLRSTSGDCLGPEGCVYAQDGEARGSLNYTIRGIGHSIQDSPKLDSLPAGN